VVNAAFLSKLLAQHPIPVVIRSCILESVDIPREYDQSNECVGELCQAFAVAEDIQLCHQKAHSDLHDTKADHGS
jgi:hypothetical protein